jgi:hypothetical protein
LSDIGLNIQEYIEIDVKEVRWNNLQSKLATLLRHRSQP